VFYWRRNTDEQGEWLIPDRGGEPYRYQSWWYHFDEACRAAGVARERYQGAHGFRKMAGGNVLELTGDPKLALDWIRDTDPRRMREYLKVRNDRLREVAERLGAPESAMKLPSEPGGDLQLVGAGEPLVGLEPTTARLRIGCSTAELQWRDDQDPGCPGADSNRDAFRHYPLKIACLPVSPPGRGQILASRREGVNPGDAICCW